MRKTLFSIPILFVLFLSCKDDNKTPMSAVGNGNGNPTSDTTGQEMLANMGNMYTAQQKQLVKIPFAPVNRDTALRWIHNYDSLTVPITHDSLIKRIWLGNKHLGVLWLKAQTVKLFIALPSSKVTGTNRVLTVLLQVKLHSSGAFEYYNMSEPLSFTAAAEDPVFCPPPYPCSSGPIEE